MTLSKARLNVHRVKRSSKRANDRRQRKRHVLLVRAKHAKSMLAAESSLIIQHSRRLTLAAKASRKYLNAWLTSRNGGCTPSRLAAKQLMFPTDKLAPALTKFGIKRRSVSGKAQYKRWLTARVSTE